MRSCEMQPPLPNPLSILKEGKRLRPDIITKSSLMVGVGETDEEIDDALGILEGGRR